MSCGPDAAWRTSPEQSPAPSDMRDLRAAVPVAITRSHGRSIPTRALRPLSSRKRITRSANSGAGDSSSLLVCASHATIISAPNKCDAVPSFAAGRLLLPRRAHQGLVSPVRDAPSGTRPIAQRPHAFLKRRILRVEPSQGSRGGRLRRPDPSCRHCAPTSPRLQSTCSRPRCAIHEVSSLEILARCADHEAVGLEILPGCADHEAAGLEILPRCADHETAGLEILRRR
jgi:hypothetical protein